MNSTSHLPVIYLQGVPHASNFLEIISEAVTRFLFKKCIKLCQGIIKILHIFQLGASNGSSNAPPGPEHPPSFWRIVEIILEQLMYEAEI